MKTGSARFGLLNYILVLAGVVTEVVGIILVSKWTALAGLALLAFGIYLWVIRKRGEGRIP